MINKINLLSKNKREQKVKIRLVINSFSGSIQEANQSEEILNFFKFRKIELSEIIDINQEMIFEKVKKIQGNIRVHYFFLKKLMKIDESFLVPQIIFDETLAVSYEHFQILNELNLIDKICNGNICCHFRFSEGKLIYPSFKFHQDDLSNDEKNPIFFNFLQSKSDCIYCYSNKKCKKNVTFFCNFRNSRDKLTNEILQYCEYNVISLYLFDIENLNSFFPCLNLAEKNSTFENLIKFYHESSQEKQDKLILIDDQIVDIDEFYNKFSKLENKGFSLNCFICNRKIVNESDKLNYLNSPQNTYFQKCEVCINNKKNQINHMLNENPQKNFKNFKNFKMKINSENKRINAYSFINKLKIHDFYSENPGRSLFEKEEKSLEFSISTSYNSGSQID